MHGWRAAWTAALALLATLAIAREVKPMDPELSQHIAQTLRLPDAAYFDFDQAAQLRLQAALAGLVNPDTPPPGALGLGAPARARQALLPTVPVLVGSVRNARRDWQVNFAPNLRLLVRHVASGRLDLLTPAISMRRGMKPMRSGAGVPPGPQQAADSLAAVQRVDLHERLGQALAPGDYRVTALVHDWVSNTVALQVGAPPAAPPPLAPQPHAGVQAAADNRAQLPSLVQLPAQAPPGQPLLLKLALQVGAEAGVMGEGQGATWAGHLLLVPLDEAVQVLPLRVPAARAQGGGPARFNVLCQVDLLQALPELADGSYQVYVETGAQVLGPYPLRVTR